MPRLRAFVAVELPPQARAEITRTIGRLVTANDGVRWVDAGLLHITLKFLGDIAREDVARIGQALAQLSAATDPFVISLSAPGCFPPRGAPRVVWTGIADQQGRLVSLHATIEKMLAPLGFPPEDRAYSPHITIGRIRDGRGVPALRSQVKGLTAPPATNILVDGLTLFQSMLDSRGPRYEPLTRFAFRNVANGGTAAGR